MATWERSRLGDLVETQKGYAFKSGWYSDVGRPIVKVSDFTADSVDSSSLVCIPEEIASDYLKYELKTGEVVIQTVGSWPANPASVVGKCVRIPSDTAGALLNQNAVKLSPTKDLDVQFLFYLLRSDDFKTYIIGTAQGAASQAAITLEAIRDYGFAVPPLPVQRRIAGILSAYDDLIENNLNRIKTIEKMARALYHETIIAAGSDIRTVCVMDTPFWKFISENVLPYEGVKRYFATAEIDKLAVCGKGIDYTFSEKPSRAQKQPTVFSVWFARMKDTFKIAWYSEVNRDVADASILSSGFAGFEATEPIFFPFLFLTISSSDFHIQKDLFCSGATQMSLTNEGLTRIQIPVPPETSIRELGARTLPLLNQMLILQRECNVLCRTRDLLLPRLLSGQVNLKVN